MNSRWRWGPLVAIQAAMVPRPEIKGTGELTSGQGGFSLAGGPLWSLCLIMVIG